MTSIKRVRGYGIEINHQSNTAHFLDGPTLAVGGIVANDNQPRRIEFIEHPGQDFDSGQCRRVAGDVFCPDGPTARFVRAAIAEKLAREAAELSRNTFRIFGSEVADNADGTVLHLATTRIEDGAASTISLALDGDDTFIVRQGQLSFSKLCEALHLSQVDNADELHGRTASFVGALTGVIDFRSAQAA
jgi:hypothetical protein